MGPWTYKLVPGEFLSLPGWGGICTDCSQPTRRFFYQRIPLGCVCSLVRAEALSAVFHPSDGRGIIAFKAVSTTSVQS